jgi:Autotransporter beta-domain
MQHGTLRDFVLLRTRLLTRTIKLSRHSGAKLKARLLTGCAVALLFPVSGFAADITIPSGTTVTTTQTLTDVGDTGIVEDGGKIDVTDQDGLVLDNDDQTATNDGEILLERTGSSDRAGIGSDGANSTITNAGTISTTGDEAFGIAAIQDDASITNSGTITTTGEDSFGILATDDRAVVRNSGSITTSGEDADGVHVDGADSQVTNNGSVTTTGEDAHGIDADGLRAQVTNNGSITTSGEGGHGIDTDRANSTATNNGTITATGENADGIDMDGDNSSAVNTGTIQLSGSQGNALDLSGDNSSATNSGTLSTSGTDSNGIESSGDNVTISNSGTIKNTGSMSGGDPTEGHGISVEGNTADITNSGTVFSDNGSSIYMGGTGASLTLNQGSLLQGIITYTDPTSGSLNYAVNRTAIYTFAGVPGTLDTNGLASSTFGSKVTIVNPDDFRLNTTASTLTALTREISGTIENQLDANRLQDPAQVATNGAAPDDDGLGNALWASPFGGVLNRGGGDGYDHSFGGLMAGADHAFSTDLRAGLMAGFSFGQTESDGDIHSSDTYSIFAGAYLSKNWQATFADLSLVGGYLNSNDDVTILNNMVTGGLQDISTGYDYVYLSPAARIGRAIALQHGTLTPAARLRYTGLWQAGDAKENTTGVTFSDRSLHVLEVRGETKYEFAPIVSDAGAWYLSLKAGADGIFTLNDSVDGTLSGAALNLSLDEDDAVLRGFATANAVWQANNGAKFLASVEGGYDTAQTLSASARLGVKLSF